jgi:GNAT superfamily N-acetyltransferase
MALIIRPAGPDDNDALVDQCLGLNVHEDRIVHDRRTDRQGAEESLAVAWQRVQETGGSALVAELDGHVVGHLFLLFREDAVYVREDVRHHAYISELFVQEEARSTGIGAALMEEAERLAAARDVSRLVVGVLAGNSLAEALYARLGYAPYAIELVKRIGSH